MVFGWVIDDLYIYFRYVNNFISGKGIVYNPGENVEGFSSFTWFIILSVCGFLKLPLEMSAKAVCFFFAFANFILIYLICRKSAIRNIWIAACCLMLFNLPFVLWSVSGFEIMFYIFLLLLCFYLSAVSAFFQMHSLVFAFLIFLISITRPEGILYSVAFIFFCFVSGEKKQALKIFLFYSLMMMLFLTFRIIYFGDILPNTYYAKIGHGFLGNYEIRSYKNGALYIFDFFKHQPQFLISFFFLPFTIKKLKRDKLFMFSSSIILIQFLFVIFSGGDWMAQYRFIVPSIPFLSLSSALILNSLIEQSAEKKSLAIASAGIFAVLIAVSFYFSDFRTIKIETSLWNNLKSISGDLKKTIPGDALVANGASGIIPYYLDDVKFLDIVGLTNKHIAKNGYRTKIWFEKNDPDYVYSNNPGWLILWKKKLNDGIYKFENASPCYFEMTQNENFRKYSQEKYYDVYDDVRIEVYKLNQ